MNLVVTGASGFIGSYLVERLRGQFHSLKLLTRKRPAEQIVSGGQWIVWQPGTPGEWESYVDGADGIINLAGEPIAGKRWSPAQKEIIRSSRVNTTRALVEAVEKAKNKPKFIINGSAVGYYGARGDETLTETSKAGEGFLADVCREWEDEARKAEGQGVRVAFIRTGIVLGKGKGALAKMVKPFKFFAGGPVGSGKQWMPWIHIDDEVGLIQFLMERADATGAFNGTAPNPVTMEAFCKILGDVLNRPSWASVPDSALTLILGEMADMVLTGQRAVPQAAQALGYHFKYPDLSEALRSLRL
jgi:uncharacterized protein (TIGR01777 family)